MALDTRLLEILRCPATGLPLALASGAQLEDVRRAALFTTTAAGRAIHAPFEAALIVADGSRAYPIQNGIPVMLDSEAILLTQGEAGA
ncbi:MAG: hypothetical protein KDI69_02560 [Xanthomonadales bacterium]|nr:hypothetical protein [Xanthomonadales bacterium]